MRQGLRSVAGSRLGRAGQGRTRLSALFMAFLRGPVRVLSCSVDASSGIEGPEGGKEGKEP